MEAVSVSLQNKPRSESESVLSALVAHVTKATAPLLSRGGIFSFSFRSRYSKSNKASPSHTTGEEKPPRIPPLIKQSEDIPEEV